MSALATLKKVAASVLGIKKKKDKKDKKKANGGNPSVFHAAKVSTANKDAKRAAMDAALNIKKKP